MSHADPQELESAIGEFIGGEDKDPEETAEDLTDMLQSNPDAIEAALEDDDSPIMDIFKDVASEDDDLMAAFQEKLTGTEETKGTTGTTTAESLFRLTRSQIRELIREALAEEVIL